MWWLTHFLCTLVHWHTVNVVTTLRQFHQPCKIVHRPLLCRWKLEAIHIFSRQFLHYVLAWLFFLYEKCLIERITAPFMQTLKFKAQLTNAFFTIVNLNVGQSSYCRVRGNQIKSLSSVQTTLWEAGRNCWTFDWW